MARTLPPNQTDVLARFRQAQAASNFLEAGNIYKDSRLSYDEKQNLFDRLFLIDRFPTSLHKSIITSGFGGVLTTNYDHLIEDAYALINGRNLIPFLPDDLKNDKTHFGRQFFVIKLHGDAARWNTLVIGEQDYASATWVRKAKSLVDGKVLVVLGVGGSDRLINEFLFCLDPRTHVVLVMAPATRQKYEFAVRSFHPEIPEHIQICDILHEDMESFLFALSPQAVLPRLIDCPWGEMPPTPVNSDAFEETYSHLMAFLESNDNTALVSSRAGWGLSSLLAQVLTTRARRNDAVVIRLEGKEWMCWPKYVLHILGSVPNVFDRYTHARHASADAWTLQSDALALAEAIHVSGRPFVVCVEHADRLPKDAWEYLSIVVSQSSNLFKLIVGTTSDIQGSFRFDLRLALGRPGSVRLSAIYRQRGFPRDRTEPILAVNEHADLNTAVLAACLHIRANMSVAELSSFVRDNDHAGLCTCVLRALEDLPSSDHLMRLLKIAVLVRSPRDFGLLYSCMSGLVSQTHVESCITTLCNLGLLNEMGGSTGHVRYGMSTTIRQTLLALLPWDDHEEEELSASIGQWYEKRAMAKLTEQQFDRLAYYREIPELSIALYHYRVANDKRRYISLLQAIFRDVTQMYLFDVFDVLLDDMASLTVADDNESDLLDVDEYLMRARLSLVASMPKDFTSYLVKARHKLTRLEKHGLAPPDRMQQVAWFEGIAETTCRNYGNALEKFRAFVHAAASEGRDDDEIKARLRIVQSLLTLARCADASEEIRLIQQVIDRAVRSSDSGLHHLAMVARHRSTLATIRILLIGLASQPAAKVEAEQLHRDAVRWATECFELSERLREVPSRRGQPDETGMGIAHLKIGQAHFAAGLFRDAIDAVSNGIVYLARYPNSRWWRMCCHEVAAKSYAYLHEFDHAEEELSRAEALWRDSSKEDELRRCELECARGIIEMSRENLADAVNHFERSIRFTSDAVCTRAIHLHYLGAAYIKARRYLDGKAIIEEISKLPIQC